jgi:nitronate monooxygenase
MKLQPVKIGKHEIKIPIIQGGMGLGISWDKLAGSVSREGALGVVSAVGTGYYDNCEYSSKIVNSRPFQEENFYSKDGLQTIIKKAKELANGNPIAVNILYASNDYDKMVRNSCEAGANIIITGAGLPLAMPEFAKDYPDVALVPIVSSAKALKIICRRWKKQHNRVPDAVIVEGPLSGGHQGFSYEQCLLEENQLENILPPIVEEAKNWDNIPVFAAGGIWDKNDIDKMINLGANGVQMGTRFIGTYECDASDTFKDVVLNSKEEDIELIKSPVGYPARGIKTNLFKLIESNEAPKVKCISNCVGPCNRGEEAKAVGYCIADRLYDAYSGRVEDGLFFTGSNGYRVNEIISVKDLINKLVDGE